MSFKKIAFRLFACLAVISLAALLADSAQAQNYGGNSSGNSSGNRSSNSSSGRNNSSGNNNNNSNSNSGGRAYPMSGVMIQADGVLQRAIAGGQVLEQARQDAAFSAVPGEMKKTSPQRKVSLNRLEAAVKASGGIFSEDMANLAGLTRIENVFVYPETGDVVLAGPAEAWAMGPEGENLGVESGRPSLQLADLVVALRAFPADGKETSLIGCSIDPTQEGLAAMQNFLNSSAKPNLGNPNEIDRYADGIENSLGLQQVQFWGISPKTSFAAKIVAADYRMKLIGIGLEEPPVKMTTYVERSTPAGIAKNALVRWYFQPNYDCVVRSEDGLAIELLGRSVNLIGEDELVAADGQRAANKGRGNRATKLYAKSFTDQFVKIAERIPVYAELRNLIDMTVVAAWLQKENVYDQIDWKADIFDSEENCPVETGTAVEKAETAVNVITHGANTVSFPTGGGVMIEPATALTAEHLQKDAKGEVAKKQATVGQAIPEGVWWWD